MQGEMQLGAVVLQGRHEANRDANQDRDEGGECEHVAIHRDGVHSGQSGRTER